MENVSTNWCKSWQKCNFWLTLDSLGAQPCKKKKKHLAENFKLWLIMKVCMVLRDVLAKTPKIIQRKEEKGHFGSNFGPILTILGKIWVIVIAKILKLKLKFLIKSFIEIMFFISSKKVVAFRSYCWFCEKFIFISAGRWSFPGWNRYLNMGIFLPKQSNNSLYLLKQTLCQSLAVTSGIGYSKKKQTGGLMAYFFENPHVLLEIPNKTKLHLWIFQKIVLGPLEISSPNFFSWSPFLEIPLCF